MFSDFKSIPEIQIGLQSGAFTLQELTNHYLSKIRMHNSELNAFIEVYENEAIDAAQSIQQKIKAGNAGKLAGLILGIKDNICYKGHKVSASSKILEGFESSYSATVLERLLQEDAIIIGRLNCDEFAMGASNETSVYGPVKNFADTTRVPGGSSGGSAVAVQSGMCHAALGSDTGGSIRQPAAFCDIWGYKPTYGMVSRYGLLAYASSFDQIGPLTKSAEDMALIMEIISGPDGYDATLIKNPEKDYKKQIPSNNPLSFAVIRDCVEHPGIDPEIKDYTLKTIELLKNQGHKVEWVDFPMLDNLVPCYYVLTTAEACSNLARYSGLVYGYRSPNASDMESTFTLSRSEGFGTEVKRRIMLGTYILSSEHVDAYYTKAQRVRNLIRKKTDEIFENYDFILLPTTSTPAFKLGEKSKDPIAMYLADLFTVHANIVGIPAISMPLGKHSNGLPFGMQLMAPFGEDVSLIRTASGIHDLCKQNIS